MSLLEQSLDMCDKIKATAICPKIRMCREWH